MSNSISFRRVFNYSVGCLTLLIPLLPARNAAAGLIVQDYHMRWAMTIQERVSPEGPFIGPPTQFTAEGNVRVQSDLGPYDPDTPLADLPGPFTINTEILSMQLVSTNAINTSLGSTGIIIMNNPNPTLRTLGQLTIFPEVGGLHRVDSFFELYTEWELTNLDKTLANPTPLQITRSKTISSGTSPVIDDIELAGGEETANGDALLLDTSLFFDWQQAETAVVPEPGSLTLVGIAALCTAAYSWRRRKRKVCRDQLRAV